MEEDYVAVVAVQVAPYEMCGEETEAVYAVYTSEAEVAEVVSGVYV